MTKKTEIQPIFAQNPKRFFNIRFVITEAGPLTWGIIELSINSSLEVSHFGMKNTPPGIVSLSP